MTLLKSMWKSVVLAGIAGVLLFAGGALAAGETVTVGRQTAAITNVGGDVSFPVTTANIPNGTYDITSAVANLPSGVTIKNPNTFAVASNAGTLTLTVANTVTPGTTATLTLTIKDDLTTTTWTAVSSAFSLVIGDKDVETVWVGEQNAAITNVGGEVSFPVTTGNIADGTYDITGMVANLPAGVTIKDQDNFVVTSNAGRLTLNVANTATPATIATLTLTIKDDLTSPTWTAVSSAFSLVIGDKDAKTVSVGRQTAAITNVGGDVSFPVTTANIPNGTYDITDMVANLPVGVTIKNPTTFAVASNAGTLTLTVANTATPATTANLTLTIKDDLTTTTWTAVSSEFSLVIGDKNAGGVQLPVIVITGASGVDRALNIGDGKTEYSTAITQYVGNIKERLWVDAKITGLATGSTFSADTGFRYTWYRTTAADDDHIIWGTKGNDVQNTFSVKSASTLAQGGNFFQLPANLAASDVNYKYFVLVSAPSLGTVAENVEKRSNFAEVTVNPRPVIKIDAQPVGYYGADSDADPSPGSGRIALTESSGGSGTLSVTAKPYVGTVDKSTDFDMKYQWYWASNLSGEGGGPIAPITSSPANGSQTKDYTLPTTLTAGTYYYYCLINSTEKNSNTDTVAIAVKTNVVRVDVNPASASSTKKVVPATATWNIANVTSITYDVPKEIPTSKATGTGLQIDVTKSPLLSGVTATPTPTWSIVNVSYQKILKTNGNAPGTAPAAINYAGTDLGSAKKAHGVFDAGTYEVTVKVKGESTKDNITTEWYGAKKVLLVVNPKNLSALTAANFSVKAPEKDTIYNGIMKQPQVTLKEGSGTTAKPLIAGRDYYVNQPGVEEKNLWVDAGTPTVKVTGCADKGTTNGCLTDGDANYIGDREGSFTIRRLPIAINATATLVRGKEYDGTDTLGADNFDIAFTPSVLPDVLLSGKDYIVSGAKFDSKDAGTRTVGGVVVKLDEANSPLAKNYTFGDVKSTAVLTSTAFSKSGVVITKRELRNGNADEIAESKSFLSYSIPKTHRYNGQSRGIGTVAWKSGVTNPNGTMEVVYAELTGSGIKTPTNIVPKGDEGDPEFDGAGKQIGWTRKPGTESREYSVQVTVKGGSNFVDGTILFAADETYKIKHRATLDSIVTKPSRKDDNYGKPSFVNGLNEDTTIFVGQTLSLKVTPVRPDSAEVKVKGSDGADSTYWAKYKGGTFAYQWFRVGADESEGSCTGDAAAIATCKESGLSWDTLTAASAKTDTYTMPALSKTKPHEFYQVRVIWNYPSVTVPDTQFITRNVPAIPEGGITEIHSPGDDGIGYAPGGGEYKSIRVRFGGERVKLTDATVSVDGVFPYTGEIYNQVGIVGDPTVSVTIPSADGPLELDTDYEMTSYGLNAGVGAGVVTITGKNAYTGTAIGYFDIDKIETSEEVLSFGTTRQYNDSIQEFSVTPISPYKGLGVVNRVYLSPKAGGEADEYDTLEGAPKDVGNYLVYVNIAEGLNFTALDVGLKPFNIVKRVLTKADFTYNFPEEHAYTGVPVDLVVATLKPSVLGYSADYKVVMLQGNTEVDLNEMPTAEGSYPIYISVEGDNNFATAMVLLGTYTIHEEGWVSVKGSNRVIPATPAVKVVSVAPVKAATAATFTAGPSPVSKASGKIAFFSTKSVKSGSLYIFDASGNAVAKLSAKAGTGEVASWNLKDKKGVVVAEGTYVVKGALASKDGTREKVSFVFSVVK